jgi:hypothetical protein
VAEGGKQLAYVFPQTLRAGDLLIAHDEQLEVLIAFITMIFKKRHSTNSLLECLSLNSKDKSGQRIFKALLMNFSNTIKSFDGTA